MAHTCSECTYLDLDKEYSSGDGRFWCETKYEWHYANEAECWRYCTAYSRSSSTADSFKKYSENTQSSSSSCYITTMISRILGLPDDNPYLNVLRTFRKEKLQKDDKYKKLLVEYDLVGPIIAEKIYADEHRMQISKNFFNMGISKVISLILKNEDDKAIKLYTDMTQILKEGYGITYEVSQDDIDNADITKSGHGVYRKKLTNGVF